jgi:hypothetical protein
MAIGSVKSLAEARSIVSTSFNVKRYEPRESGKWAQAYDRYRAMIGK